MWDLALWTYRQTTDMQQLHGRLQSDAFPATMSPYILGILVLVFPLVELRLIVYFPKYSLLSPEPGSKNFPTSPGKTINLLPLTLPCHGGTIVWQGGHWPKVILGSIESARVNQHQNDDILQVSPYQSLAVIQSSNTFQSKFMNIQPVTFHIVFRST